MPACLTPVARQQRNPAPPSASCSARASSSATSAPRRSTHSVRALPGIAFAASSGNGDCGFARQRTSISKIHSVEGVAIYLTSQTEGVPPALLHNLKHNSVLHKRVILLTVDTALTPSVPSEQRIKAQALGDGIERVVLRFGFMETPHVPAALALLPDPPAPMETTFVLARQLRPSTSLAVILTPAASAFRVRCARSKQVRLAGAPCPARSFIQSWFRCT